MHGTDSWFHINGLHIHCKAWKNPISTALPLVILHGLWESWHTFAELAPRCAQKRSVYALDLRGHGESDKPETGYRLQDYATDIEGVLKQLPHPQVHLLGHSLGALVALQVAGDAPRRVATLTLEDPPFILPHQQVEIHKQMEHLLALKRQPFDAVVADFTSQPSVLKRAWFEMTARDFLNAADGPFVTLMNNTVTEKEWATLLGRIAVPTLVLAASPADGGWMGEEHHTLVRKALPSARLVDFPGCGHHIEAICTESFLATVEAFLDDPMQEARGSVAL